MSLQEQFGQIKEYLSNYIIAQEELVERLLIALLADGHLIVEGAPGLAKTTAIKALACALEGDFQRIQFTPDLLPADITGSDIFRPQTGEFVFQAGPIFHNLVLTDEINRAPAKVQSALLEAMAEGQVSVGQTTYPLPELFLVMATQNPIEQEGTFSLPEAQCDRFLMHVVIGYPDAQAEQQILQLSRTPKHDSPEPPANKLSQQDIFAAREELNNLTMVDSVEKYIIDLVMATRPGASIPEELAGYIEFGASPRGTIALDRCSRARAWLHGRDFVTPDDVQAIAYDVLRHRLGISFQAEAKGIDSDEIIRQLIQHTPIA